VIVIQMPDSQCNIKWQAKTVRKDFDNAADDAG
jgi:hypothetical protein